MRKRSGKDKRVVIVMATIGLIAAISAIAAVTLTLTATAETAERFESLASHFMSAFQACLAAFFGMVGGLQLGARVKEDEDEIEDAGRPRAIAFKRSRAPQRKRRLGPPREYRRDRPPDD